MGSVAELQFCSEILLKLVSIEIGLYFLINFLSPVLKMHFTLAAEGREWNIRVVKLLLQICVKTPPIR